jgi:hypothetical protein
VLKALTSGQSPSSALDADWAEGRSGWFPEEPGNSIRLFPLEVDVVDRGLDLGVDFRIELPISFFLSRFSGQEVCRHGWVERSARGGGGFTRLQSTRAQNGALARVRSAFVIN